MWQNFSFAIHLTNMPQKMFKKVEPFTMEHQLLPTHCVFVCADGASGMTRIKSLYEFMKKENKNI